MFHFIFHDKNIFYKLVGNKNSYPIIMLHGNMSNHKRWLPLAELLKKHFACYALDFPGSGLSEDIDEYHSLDILADCADAFIKHIHADKYILFGHSMGGGIAQLIALKNPNSVKAMVLINSISFKGFHEFYKQKDYIASMYRNKNLLNEIFNQSFPDFSEKKVISEMVDDAYKASKRVFTDEAKAMSEFNLEDSIHMLNIPTLIMHSKEDQIVSEPDAAQMHSKLQNSIYVSIDSSGHSPHFEDPTSVYGQIMGFYNELLEAN